MGGLLVVKGKKGITLRGGDMLMLMLVLMLILILILGWACLAVVLSWLKGASLGCSVLDLSLGFSQALLHYHVHDATRALFTLWDSWSRLCSSCGCLCLVLFL